MTTLCVNYKRKVTRFLKLVARRIPGLARPAREKYFWKDPRQVIHRCLSDIDGHHEPSWPIEHNHQECFDWL